MSELLERCKVYGVDVEGVMDRFMDDEELFETCLEAFVVDGNFAKLGQNIQEKKYKEAFENAHTLKGVAANMGLIPLYEIVSEVTEQLRADNYDNLEPKYEKICIEQDNVKGLLQKKV